jgi:hypothetical protein
MRLDLGHMAPCRPTVVYDTYWRFAAERQAIFFRRLEGLPAPWTDDPILRKYAFTNVYRASDRVSQYLIKNVIYTGDSSPKELVFRIILFKLFNRIGTWRLLETKLGCITHADYSFDRYDAILSAALQKGKLFSGAYIMPSGSRSFAHRRKHRNMLELVDRMMKDDFHLRISDASSMQEVFELLRSYPMIGDFLAYQLAIDINYSELTDFSETQFVVAGPGAKDGIRKCFSDYGGLNEEEIIRVMADRQEKEFERLGLQFRSLWERRLQLIDCQNLFCEVDKYARLAHPEILGRSKRTRMKRLFRMNPEPINYWYPPKWGLNDRIAGAQKTTSLDGRRQPADPGGQLWDRAVEDTR